jgi:RimJ/RimL family protein N-acetyltransferase
MALPRRGRNHENRYYPAMSSAEAPPPVSREVRLAGSGIELRPLDVDHAVAFDEAVRESAAELAGTMPWWRPEATVADQEAWARFTRDAWEQGTLYAFVILDGDGTLLGACSLDGSTGGGRRRT